MSNIFPNRYPKLLSPTPNIHLMGESDSIMMLAYQMSKRDFTDPAWVPSKASRRLSTILEKTKFSPRVL